VFGLLGYKYNRVKVMATLGYTRFDLAYDIWSKTQHWPKPDETCNECIKRGLVKKIACKSCNHKDKLKG
jgi:hypothetical protein